MSIVDGVAAVENFWARVWQARAPEAVDELVHEDFVIVNAGSEIRGRAAFKTWVEGFLDAVHDLEFTVVETFQNSDGTRVCSLWELTGRNNGIVGLEPDGRPVHLTGTAVWDVHPDGTLLRNRVERNAFELHQRLANS
jgi:ketosteroid isomerase-like protein